MYESPEQWRAVDDHFVQALVGEDAALARARAACRDAGLPDHEVAPHQGALLSLLARMCRARRILADKPNNPRYLAAGPRLDATALQTVGSKGWDGLALALVR